VAIGASGARENFAFPRAPGRPRARRPQLRRLLSPPALAPPPPRPSSAIARHWPLLPNGHWQFSALGWPGTTGSARRRCNSSRGCASAGLRLPPLARSRIATGPPSGRPTGRLIIPRSLVAWGAVRPQLTKLRRPKTIITTTRAAHKLGSQSGPLDRRPRISTRSREEEAQGARPPRSSKPAGERQPCRGGGISGAFSRGPEQRAPPLLETRAATFPHFCAPEMARVSSRVRLLLARLLGRPRGAPTQGGRLLLEPAEYPGLWECGLDAASACQRPHSTGGRAISRLLLVWRQKQRQRQKSMQKTGSGWACERVPKRRLASAPLSHARAGAPLALGQLVARASSVRRAPFHSHTGRGTAHSQRQPAGQSADELGPHSCGPCAAPKGTARGPRMHTVSSTVPTVAHFCALHSVRCNCVWEPLFCARL